MVIVPYIRHNAVHTAQCRMPYEICRTGARILSIMSFANLKISNMLENLRFITSTFQKHWFKNHWASSRDADLNKTIYEHE